jgi:serine/threonine protein kinase/tetratricopeptide (TPR) repeat protein
MSEREIFVAALQKDDPAQRAAHLDQACAGDADLRRRIETLLQAHAQSGDFLERPSNPGANTTGPPPGQWFDLNALPVDSEGPGTRIGPYKLLQTLGEGGMGTVFLAEQEEPVKRRVALKIIKAGMDSARVIARFEAERQALAMMDHPNIAKVLDAGTTERGRPYFVMELVKGIPITKFCDQEHLTPKERLELFIPVCQAVQHAHQKGIIHRDLKPSNVLIALYDGKAVPKVIDFGVAKATAQKLTERTMFTEVGQIVGTLEYMAPEQAELNNLDIDTRADIYSLGVILYELLTGSPPFTAKQLRSAAFTEMLRIIREVEPPKPSTRLSSSEELPSIAANRKLEPKRLTILVHGDLDWIVMKCLQKERSRRYETANGLALEVQRYLADEPVLAGPPSVRYRLRKFARKHRGPVVAGVIITVLLTGGIVGTSLGFLRAERLRQIAEANEQTALDEKANAVASAFAEHKAKENETAERKKAVAARAQALQVLRDTTDDMMEQLIAARPTLGRAEKAFLENTLKRWQTFAAEQGTGQPEREVRGEGMLRVAALRGALGERDSAFLASQREATAHWEKMVADFPTVPLYCERLATCYNNLGAALRDLGQRAEAEVLLRRALPIWDQLNAQKPSELEFRERQASSRSALGILLSEEGKSAEAEAAYTKALALQEKMAAEFPATPLYRHELASTYDRLGILFAALGRHGEAEAAHRTALTRMGKLNSESPDVPAYRRDLASIYNNLGTVLRDVGRLSEAATNLRQGRTLYEKLVAEFPAQTDYQRELAGADFNLGLTLFDLGNYAEAETVDRQALALLTKLADDFPAVIKYREELAMALNNLGLLLVVEGKPAEAEAAQRQALGLREKLVADFPGVGTYRGEQASTYLNLGLVLRDLEKRAGEEAAYRKAISILDPLIQEFPAVSAYRETLSRALTTLGRALAMSGKRANAEAAYRRARTLLEKLAAESPAVPAYRYLLAEACDSLGNLLKGGNAAEAEALMRQATALADRLTAEYVAGPPHHRRNLAAGYYNFALLLRDQGRFGEAEAYCQKALPIWTKLSAAFPAVPQYRLELAAGYNEQGNLLRALGKRGPAEAAHRQALGIREKLAADFPAMVAYRIDLGGSQVNFGHLLRESNQSEQALAWYAKGIASLERAIEQAKGDATARLYLRNAHAGRAEALSELKRYADSLPDWDKAMDLSPWTERPMVRLGRATSRVRAGQVDAAIKDAEELARMAPPEILYNAACIFALAADRPKEAGSVTSKEECAKRAVALLRQAVAKGFKDVQQMKSDDDLKAMRQREDFRKLLADLEKPPRIETRGSHKPDKP